MSFGSFSLRELTCMHCVYLALWTRKVLCGRFLCAIDKFSFIHSCKQSTEPWRRSPWPIGWTLHWRGREQHQLLINTPPWRQSEVWGENRLSALGMALKHAGVLNQSVPTDNTRTERSSGFGPAGKAGRLVSRRASARFCFGSPFSSERLWFVDTVFWLCPSQFLKH